MEFSYYLDLQVMVGEQMSVLAPPHGSEVEDAGQQSISLQELELQLTEHHQLHAGKLYCWTMPAGSRARTLTRASTLFLNETGAN